MYDLSGNLTEMRDQGGHATRWSYDAEGRRIAKVYADGTTNAYAYNAEAQLTSRRDALGRVTQYRYDPAANLTNIQYQTDAPVFFSYDALNRTTRMTDGVGTTEYAYATDCGLVSTATGPFGDAVEYAYDHGKRLTNVTFRGESRRYAWDDLNRMAAVAGGSAEAAYAYVGTTRRVARLQRGNGVATDYDFDPLGRLTNVAHAASAQEPFSSFAYTPDDADQRVRVTRENGFHIDYEHDFIGQLVGADGKDASGAPAPGWQFGYRYD